MLFPSIDAGSVNREPNSTNIYIFSKAGIDPMSRKTKFNILCEMTRNINVFSRPPLNITHKEKRIVWAEKCLKTDSQKVQFTDENRITLE